MCRAGAAPPCGTGTPKAAAPLPHAKRARRSHPACWGAKGPALRRGPHPAPPALTVVSPGHEDVLQAAARLVHPVLGAGEGAGWGARGWTPPSAPDCHVGCGARCPTAPPGALPGGPPSPVQRVSGVGVVVEGGVPEDHGLLHLAAHGEGVPHHGPLRRGATGIPKGGALVPRPAPSPRRLWGPTPRCGAMQMGPRSPGAPQTAPGPSPGRAATPRGGTSLGASGAVTPPRDMAPWGAACQRGGVSPALPLSGWARRMPSAVWYAW